MVDVLQILLALLQLVLFGLSLGLTVISFQAYTQHGSDQLEYAFIGFAFISMGTALSNLSVQTASSQETLDVVGVALQLRTVLEVAETVPFIVGFSMLYLSLYR
jgi:hypothetical protein